MKPTAPCDRCLDLAGQVKDLVADIETAVDVVDKGFVQIRQALSLLTNAASDARLRVRALGPEVNPIIIESNGVPPSGPARPDGQG